MVSSFFLSSKSSRGGGSSTSNARVLFGYIDRPSTFGCGLHKRVVKLSLSLEFPLVTNSTVSFCLKNQNPLSTPPPPLRDFKDPSITNISTTPIPCRSCGSKITEEMRSGGGGEERGRGRDLGSV
jgi:hypothetical protein